MARRVRSLFDFDGYIDAMTAPAENLADRAAEQSEAQPRRRWKHPIGSREWEKEWAEYLHQQDGLEAIGCLGLLVGTAVVLGFLVLVGVFP